MKKFLITNAEKIERRAVPEKIVFEAMAEGGEEMQVSDGYHTMDELYDHRIALYVALCKQICNQPYGEGRYGVWRSKLHSDGSSFEGWFVLGIGKEAGRQITYHLPTHLWGDTYFAETLLKAPDFDGHNPNDVLNRLKEL